VPIEELQSRGILVDRDEDGYLLQIFHSRSATGRGVLRVHRAARLARLRHRQFQALFEAIERRAAKRGNF